jgi:hypothetical protein
MRLQLKVAKMSLLAWVPCHHGMARPQVADGRDALHCMEGRCEYIEKAVTDSRQGVVLQLGVGANNTPP